MNANQTEPVAARPTHGECTEPPSSTACSPALPCGAAGWGLALPHSLCRGEAREPLETAAAVTRPRRRRD